MPVQEGGGVDNVVGSGDRKRYTAPTYQTDPLHSPTYSMPYASGTGGNFYYHPTGGVGTMTGGWGDPRGGGSRSHTGQDIRIPMNTPLIAVTSGKVTHYENSSAGTVIYLHGDDGNKYSYFHLNRRLAPHNGQVKAGQVIGLSGDSGNSSAPHLHFETWINGRKVDPALFLSHTKTLDTPVRGGGAFYGPGDTPQTAGDVTLDLFGEEAFYGRLDDIFANVDMSPEEMTDYGSWADQLRQFQAILAERGLAEPPRKMKAKNLMHSTLAGMASMVRRDGYQGGSTSLPSSVPGVVAEGGSNVVEGAPQETSNVVPTPPPSGAPQ